MKLKPDFSLSCFFDSFLSLSILLRDWWKAGHKSDQTLRRSIPQCKLWDQLGPGHNISNLQKGPRSRACLPLWHESRMIPTLHTRHSRGFSHKKRQNFQPINETGGLLSKPQLGHCTSKGPAGQLVDNETETWGPSMFTKAPGGLCLTFTCDTNHCRSIVEQRRVMFSKNEFIRKPTVEFDSMRDVCHCSIERAAKGRLNSLWSLESPSYAGPSALSNMFTSRMVRPWSRAMSHFPCLHRTIGE